MIAAEFPGLGNPMDLECDLYELAITQAKAQCQQRP